MAKRQFELLGIDHIVLRVHQLQPMLEFYQNVLGCKLVRSNEKIGLYQLSAGASMIDLIPVDMELGKKGGEPPGLEGHNVDHIALKVYPFEEEEIKNYLSSKNLKMSKIETRFGAEGSGPSVYVEDPEGNSIELKGVERS